MSLMGLIHWCTWDQGVIRDTGVVLMASPAQGTSHIKPGSPLGEPGWGSNGHSLLSGSGRSQILSTPGDLSSLLQTEHSPISVT